ncbi:Phosphoenolpyruvate-protein phosphotransferase [Planctomycetes bacterium Pla163]|uniref:Phosphoenolpyruvate-protein phosphotransferase n=1 Tax=Rohdeia mirabilis TaxID=2528008 RepID=A0A518CX40_9BACT|nr:Phosphoenolpyruvate-protein phosphotransferase [Planctomycetes bacterium Pla163]
MVSSRVIRGLAVSAGLAVGPAHIVRAGSSEVPTWYVRAQDIGAEIERLEAAVRAVEQLLGEQQARVARTTNAKDAEIFAVHRMILSDPTAIGNVEKAISEEAINAEAAIQRLIDRFEVSMGKLEGAPVRAFAADVSDPWRRVLDMLLERDRAEVGQAQEQVVLVAPELTPQVIAFVDRSRVLAVLCEKGGRFSHGAVLARSMRLPCIVGLPGLLGRLEQNMEVWVDGDNGIVQLEPEEADRAEFEARIEAREGRQKAVAAFAKESARTVDGARLVCEANIESVHDLDTFDLDQIDGVGLLRTEFLYMEKREFPSEEEQYRMYRRVAERLGERPVTIRTLDIGGDKQLEYFRMPPERNPALGWRGLRVSLQWPDLLRVQLRAAMRASVSGALRVLLPMVSSVDQLEEALAIFDGLRLDLDEQGYSIPDDIPLGVMVEVPSAIFNLRSFLDEIDFVSVGTNDLVQYLLAVDRDNSWVAKLYEPYDPSVFQALRDVADACAEKNKPCSVCGDLASDPLNALVLLGLGYHSVSVAPHFVPEIKYLLRSTTMEKARELAEAVTSQRRARDVRELMREAREELYEEIDGA